MRQDQQGETMEINENEVFEIVHKISEVCDGRPMCNVVEAMKRLLIMITERSFDSIEERCEVWNELSSSVIATLATPKGGERNAGANN
jgi:hypothetical protein